MEPMAKRSGTSFAVVGLCFVATTVSMVTVAAPAARAADGVITEFVIPTPNSVPDGITAAHLPERRRRHVPVSKGNFL